MVITPICNFCAKTGVLCKKCKLKLRKGKITNLEVEVSKVFANANQKFPKQLQNVTLDRAHGLGASVVLLTRNGINILENDCFQFACQRLTTFRQLAVNKIDTYNH